MPRTIRLFVSSPSDVPRERDVVDKVARDIARSLNDEIEFDVIRWERQALEATASFQQGIERELEPEDMDIAVFIVWQRLGSPLGSNFKHPETGEEYQSGTEYEFDLMLRAWEANGQSHPHILFYVKEQRKSISIQTALSKDDSPDRDIEQSRALRDFLQTRFSDAADGTNVRAYHPFPEPITFEAMLRHHLEDALRKILKDDPSSSRLRATWRDRPFPGLRAFTADERAIFCGRDHAIYQALTALRDQEKAGTSFLMLIGASGSGKSSLARAGILPEALTGSADEQQRFWHSTTMTPSENASAGDLCDRLVHTLMQPNALPQLRTHEKRASELADLTRSTPQELGAQVRDKLSEAAEAAGEPKDDSRLFLLIDQFEEVFTDRSVTEADREQFVAALAALASSGSVWVVVTVRSDFYPQIQSLPVLAELKAEKGTLDLLPPTAAELAQIITHPALKAGLSYETNPKTNQRLDRRILDDALALGGATFLPLLEFALEQLYENRTPEGMLTFERYEHLGGVSGTLARHADQTFEQLSRAAQAALPGVLAALVSLSDDDLEVRQRADKEPLKTDPARAELIDAFEAARLFTGDKDAEGNAIITIAHESLLQHWERASNWVVENREFLRARKRLEASATLWVDRKRDTEYLLPEGKLLAEAEELVVQNRDALSAEATELVETSRAAANERAERLRNEREEKLIADRKKARRWLAAVSVVAVVALILGGVNLGLFQRAEQARDEAEKQRGIADSNAQEAVSERNAADAARAEAEKLLATSSVQLANSWLRVNRNDLARESLDQTPEHLRNWEWGYLRNLASPYLLSHSLDKAILEEHARYGITESSSNETGLIIANMMLTMPNKDQLLLVHDGDSRPIDYFPTYYLGESQVSERIASISYDIEGCIAEECNFGVFSVRYNPWTRELEIVQAKELGASQAASEISQLYKKLDLVELDLDILRDRYKIFDVTPRNYESNYTIIEDMLLEQYDFISLFNHPLLLPSNDRNWVPSFILDLNGRNFTILSDSTITVIDLKSKVSRNYSSDLPEIREIKLNEAGDRVALTDGYSICTIELESGVEKYVMIDKGWAASGMSWSPNGNLIAIVNNSGSLSVWTLDGEQLYNQNISGDNRTVAMYSAWSADSSQVSWWCDCMNTATIINVEQGTTQKIATHTDDITSVSWSPDSSRILTTSHDGSAWIHDAVTAEPIIALQTNGTKITDGRWIEEGIILIHNYNRVEFHEAAPYRVESLGAGPEAMDLNDQFKLWQLKRYRDWQVRQHADELGDDTLHGDPRLQAFREDLTQKFRDAYPDWAQWF